MKVWSMFPHKSYSIIIYGKLVGIGMDPVWDAVPGAWNLFWLTWPPLEELLKWERPPEQFPQATSQMPHAIGMALQEYSKQQTLGQLATTTSPTQFLSMLEKHPGRDTFIFPAMFGKGFWNTAWAQAKEYHGFTDNVIRVEFGCSSSSLHSH